MKLLQSTLSLMTLLYRQILWFAAMPIQVRDQSRNLSIVSTRVCSGSRKGTI